MLLKTINGAKAQFLTIHLNLSDTSCVTKKSIYLGIDALLKDRLPYVLNNDTKVICDFLISKQFQKKPLIITDYLVISICLLQNLRYLCCWIAEYAFLQMAFRLLLLLSKTTKLLLRTHNRHIKCSRLLAWVCLCSYGCLVVPSQ